MKKKFLYLMGSMLLTLVFVSSCQKQTEEPDQNGNVYLKSGSLANVTNSYRLLVDKGLSDGFLQWYHYNDLGLADEYHAFKPDQYNMWATMEYNERNLISKATFYYSEEDYYDIVFDYVKNKLVKETWYLPGTDVVVDYYINTYNSKGQLAERNDPPYELKSIYKYDATGNCTNVEIFDYQGNLYLGEEFTYSKPIKNPFESVTGLPVAWLWVDDHLDQNRFTGFKYYFNDEGGNRVLIFDWESSETEIRTGMQNYAVYQNSRDAISDTWTDQTWTYESNAGNRGSAHIDISASQGKANSNALNNFKFRSNTFRQEMKKLHQKYSKK
jgi:hypothetical protein